MSKKPEPKLIYLDDLIKRCGYFNANTQLNNGYGCKHRGNKDEPGKCFSFCCPVAVNADYEDLLKLDPELAKEYEESEKECGFIECDWMVVYKAMYLKRCFKA